MSDHHPGVGEIVRAGYVTARPASPPRIGVAFIRPEPTAQWGEGPAVNRSDWVVARAKFGVPDIPNASVPREALLQRLRAGAGQKLTIVAAPPGSGKTALLTQWMAEVTDPVAWLSCDTDDADPACFWHDVSVAVQDAWAPFGAIAPALYHEWGSRELAVELANELASLGQEGFIVLDDFQMAGGDPLVMQAFVAALPRNVRLVLGSRSLPPFPVARLRVQGNLLELRQDDLRLGVEETRQLLAGLGVELAADELQRLESVTEGWAAAVQLAGLSLHGRGDRQALLDSMLTTDHSVVDFLTNEVIDTQPADIQDFLMVTGELDTFDAALCAAVGGWADSVELLDRVRSANLFLVELPGSPGTYRYHHLFGQFLRGRLRAVASHRVRDIHDAAAKAYQQRSDPLAALRHRMLAGDTDAAFDDLRDYVVSLQSLDDRAIALASARVLLAEFGAAQLERAPIKVLDCALALSVGGATDETATWLGRVEARESDLDASTVFELHGVWSFYHMQRGDFSAALQRARRAQDMWRRAHIENQWAYVLPNVLVQAHQWLGDLDAAEAELQALRMPTLLPVSTDVRAPGFGSYLQVLRGEFIRAQTLANEALAAADRLGLPPLNFGRAEPELALAEIAIEHNRLDDGQARLDRVMQIAEGGRRPPIEFLTHLQQARLAAARGDHDAAEESMREARRVFSDPKPPVLVLHDQVAARLALDRGDHASAGAFLSRLPPSPAVDLIGARLHLAEGRAGEAQSVLARVPVSGLVRARVECGLLSALAHRESDRRMAYNALEAALLAGQRAGLLMTVVGEGPQLWSLLESLPASATIANYVAGLLETARGFVPARRPVQGQRLTEPLSDRELTVLRHLSSRLDSTEIAAGLFVSVNTVRTHVKAIYRKLGVNSRIDAVSRGRALALL